MSAWEDYDEDVDLRCAELGWVPYVGDVEQAHRDLAEIERLSGPYGVTSMSRRVDWTGDTLARRYWRGDVDVTAEVLRG